MQYWIQKCFILILCVWSFSFPTPPQAECIQRLEIWRHARPQGHRRQQHPSTFPHQVQICQDQLKRERLLQERCNLLHLLGSDRRDAFQQQVQISTQTAATLVRQRFWRGCILCLSFGNNQAWDWFRIFLRNSWNVFFFFF